MRCAVMHGAHGDTNRARGTSTTPPSAVRSAHRAPAGASRQVSTADPEALHRSGTTPRAGTPRWPHTGGETPHRFIFLVMRCPPLLFSPPGHGLATTGCSSEVIDMTAYQRNRERGR